MIVPSRRTRSGLGFRTLRDPLMQLGRGRSATCIRLFGTSRTQYEDSVKINLSPPCPLAFFIFCCKIVWVWIAKMLSPMQKHTEKRDFVICTPLTSALDRSKEKHLDPRKDSDAFSRLGVGAEQSIGEIVSRRMNGITGKGDYEAVFLGFTDDVWRGRFFCRRSYNELGKGL